MDLPPKLLDLAKRAQQACNLRLCAVDVVTLNNGEDHVPRKSTRALRWNTSEAIGRLLQFDI